MDIHRSFAECAARSQRHFFTATHLDHDRAFEHVHKDVCIMSMKGVTLDPGACFNAEHRGLFARNVGKVLG